MNAPVNIVYPIDGATYSSASYITLSFSTTCPGGPMMTEWGVDGQTLGKAEFYDEYTTQLTWKLPKGTHVFWVRASCGEDQVKFKLS